MMSQFKAPIYSYKSGDKNPVICYQISCGNFYRANETSYINLNLKSVPLNIYLGLSNNQSLENSFSLFFNCLFHNKKAVYPNPYYKKINLSNFEYKILDKQVVFSDQSLGTVHPFLYRKEEKIIKVGTIIFISHMAMTSKIIAMFTFSMGTLALKVTLLIFM